MFITAALFCPILAPGLLSLNNTIKFLFYRESGTKWKMLKLALFLYYLISFVSPQLSVSILQGSICHFKFLVVGLQFFHSTFLFYCILLYCKFDKTVYNSITVKDKLRLDRRLFTRHTDILLKVYDIT